MNCFKCHLKIENSDLAIYGLHPDCFSRWFKVPSSARFVSLQRRNATSNQTVSYSSQNLSFFHGKFKKYSADLIDHSYILKMRQPDAPELPEVEYVCNQIGKILSIPVAEFYFIEFNGDQTFVTKNFIQSKMPTDLHHIYHFRADDEHSCEALIRVIKEQTKSPYDLNIFIKTLLFDALIGNHDRHGRNLAFIITSKKITLSPIYDNVSYLSLETGSMLKADFHPTGKISTSSTYEPSMSDYVKELRKLNYNSNVEQFFKIINLANIFQLIDNSFCSDLMKNALKSLINKRYRELENELFN